MKWLETSLSLTKTLDDADYVLLKPELAIVDLFPLGPEQHQHRRWEYAMCVRAIRTWNAARDFAINVECLDIGGAGSSLSDVLRRRLGFITFIIDPSEGTGTLAELGKAPVYIPRTAAIVISISTIEHVQDVERFTTDLAAAVKPGGLLFLTTDVRGASMEDAAGDAVKDDRHFHWMRKRIYSPGRLRALGCRFIDAGFRYFGPPDWDYHGDHVYDYSFASMALVKGRPA